MVQLSGGTDFISLCESDSDNNRIVKCYNSFDQFIKQSSDSYRVSPIFPLDKAPLPNFKKTKKSSLIFFGPVYPGELDFENNISLYLTLGTFNVLSWCEEEAEIFEVQKFIRNKQLISEEWIIENSSLIEVKTHKLPISSNSLYPEIKKLKLPILVSEDIRISAREYSLLIHKATIKSCNYWNSQTKEFLDFHHEFKEVQNLEVDDLGRLTNFVVANSALSRFISQAYAGTTPILETECSYTTNSLLGIGLANQVLTILRRFSTKIFYEERLLQRVKLLKSLSPSEKPLPNLDGGDKFYKTDHLYSSPIIEGLEDIIFGKSLPNITCYSERDGFRATRFSLSAPMEVISQANTFEWTLMTLTHEISHIFIDGVLGEFFTNPKDVDKNKERFELLANCDNSTVGTSPKNLYDNAEQLLLYGLALLYKENRSGLFDGNGENYTVDTNSQINIQQIIIEGSAETKEIMTHIFDYLYFYNQNIELYIKSVWSSWAVVPNIETRIPNYLVRTLCAIYSKNMEWENGFEKTFDEVKRHLGLLAESKDKDQIQVIHNALDLLEKDWKEIYSKALMNRIAFIKFVRAFLYSPEISKQITREIIPVASSLGFRRDRISNPLNFLEAHANESKPAMLKSVWMLQHLAFCNLE